MSKKTLLLSTFGLFMTLIFTSVGIAPMSHAQGPDANGMAGVTTAQLNVRTAPHTTAPVLTTLPQNTLVMLDGRNAASTWLMIHTPDQTITGWVAAGYVSVSGDTRALPLMEATVSAPTDSTAAPVVVSTGETLGTTRGELNVRMGPGTRNAVIGKLTPNTTVIVEGRNRIGDWVMVHTADGSVRGWVASRYLSLPIAPARLPLIQEEQIAVSAAAAGDIQAVINLPHVASATSTARAIYQRGITRGNNPRRFSVVGDCQAVKGFFLGMFDKGAYRLGEYSHLQSTIDYFAGSWNRDNVTVWNGFTIYSVLDATWSDPALCRPGETPLACEYRLWKPSFAIISMEVWYGDPADYEANLRAVVDFWMSRDVVPILATKADNVEGDWSINLVIARVAQEYGLPLWNFLGVAQGLPYQGMTDGFHLTHGPAYFDDAATMQNAWPQRNLTALQSLDAVMRGVQ